MLMNITNYTLQSKALDNKFRVRGSRHGGRDDKVNTTINLSTYRDAEIKRFPRVIAITIALSFNSCFDRRRINN